MKQDALQSIVRDIMAEFADLTGLSSDETPARRYLWTDAFAVCNFLEIYDRTGNSEFKRLALSLVDQVHNILGRHREDDTRKGWISGLDEQEGRKHPAIGGLRIGKKLNERGPADLFDEHLEWEKDGQYYHYLTKWMHALNRVSRVTGDATFNIWARELAKTAHAKFTHAPSGSRRKQIYWKMSIDLSYPLVASMGQHDPLDGYITYNELQATATADTETLTGPALNAEIDDMSKICEGKKWVTDDPLGIGELLGCAYKVVQLIVNGYFRETEMLEILLDSSRQGLELYLVRSPLNFPADYRLAFRELGLSIGLRAAERMQKLIEQNPKFSNEKHLLSRVESMIKFLPLSEGIEKFWLDPASRESPTWIEHRDINMVMLATSLTPDGYLTI